MKYIILTCRILLGVGFTFFGANHILNFFKMAPPPGDAGTFGMLLFTHHFFAFVGFIQLVGGILLLVGRFVPLALTLLGPILVNILLYDFLFDPKSLPPGLACTLFWLVLFFAYIRSFLPLFAADPTPSTKAPTL
jgi:uncharacterized membrane protein YphA (DoxX/SURF4 family)